MSVSRMSLRGGAQFVRLVLTKCEMDEMDLTNAEMFSRKIGAAVNAEPDVKTFPKITPFR